MVGWTFPVKPGLSKFSGQTTGKTVSGQTTGKTVSGQTTGKTFSGQTTGKTVSGQTTGKTVSGQTTGKTFSGQTTGKTFSGQTTGKMRHASPAARVSPMDVTKGRVKQSSATPARVGARETSKTWETGRTSGVSHTQWSWFPSSVSPTPSGHGFHRRRRPHPALSACCTSSVISTPRSHRGAPLLVHMISHAIPLAAK